MAQFDVYENPSKQTKSAYPYILDIQHNFIEDISTRIVVPLGDAKKLKGESLKGLTPSVSFEDKELLILIPQITSIPEKILNKPIGTLVDFRAEIIASLDLAISGI